MGRRKEKSMKVILQNKNTIVLRFDLDEEVINELAHFCLQQQIHSGAFSAIGAAKEVIIACYNLQDKKYEDMTIIQEVEIVGVLGNIATMEGKTVVHAHGSFSDETYMTKAGHVKKLVVSATCEVILNVFEGTIERAYDERTGLSLMQ